MSDYLTDEEQLDKLKAWWEKNGLTLLAAVVVAVIGVVGWNWYGDYSSGVVSRASELYTDYVSATGTERETIADTIASEFPGSTYHTLVLLRFAESRMAEDDPEGASARLTEALQQAPDPSLADLIRLRLARVQQQLDRSEDALATLANVKSLGYRAQVQELKGDIHMARSERAAAHEAYSAALLEAGDGTQRPLLEMKVADTADANDA